MEVTQTLEQLKKVNWKRHLHTTMMVVMDFKVLGLIALSGMTVYGIGWDTVVRPSMEALKSRDNAIKEQNETLQKRQQLQHEYGDLEQKLSHLDTQLVILHQGTSSKIVSVTEAAELTDLALGKLHSPSLPELPAPHNTRENVDLKPTDNSTIDLLHPNGEAPQASTPPPSPSPSPGPALGGQTATADQQAANTPMPADRYNYELSVTGTYPALMDLLNELASRKKLVRISKISITNSKSQTESIPDAKEYPDYPLKLDMVVTLSLYMYADNNAAPSSAP